MLMILPTRIWRDEILSRIVFLDLLSLLNWISLKDVFGVNFIQAILQTISRLTGLPPHPILLCHHLGVQRRRRQHLNRSKSFRVSLSSFKRKSIFPIPLPSDPDCQYEHWLDGHHQEGIILWRSQSLASSCEHMNPVLAVNLSAHLRHTFPFAYHSFGEHQVKLIWMGNCDPCSGFSRRPQTSEDQPLDWNAIVVLLLSGRHTPVASSSSLESGWIPRYHIYLQRGILLDLIPVGHDPSGAMTPILTTPAFRTWHAPSQTVRSKKNQAQRNSLITRHQHGIYVQYDSYNPYPLYRIDPLSGSWTRFSLPDYRVCRHRDSFTGFSCGPGDPCCHIFNVSHQGFLSFPSHTCHSSVCSATLLDYDHYGDATSDWNVHMDGVPPHVWIYLMWKNEHVFTYGLKDLLKPFAASLLDHGCHGGIWWSSDSTFHLVFRGFEQYPQPSSFYCLTFEVDTLSLSK